MWVVAVVASTLTTFAIFAALPIFPFPMFPFPVFPFSTLFTLFIQRLHFHVGGTTPTGNPIAAVHAFVHTEVAHPIEIVHPRLHSIVHPRLHSVVHPKVWPHVLSITHCHPWLIHAPSLLHAGKLHSTVHSHVIRHLPYVVLASHVPVAHLPLRLLRDGLFGRGTLIDDVRSKKV